MRTKSNIKMLYWWPKKELEIELFVRACVKWECADTSQKVLYLPMSPLGCQRLPCEEIVFDLDIMRLGTWSDGTCRYIIVLIDMFSRWKELEVVCRVDTAVMTFLEDIFLRKGFPAVILTDNCVQFKSEVKPFVHFAGIAQKFTV